MCIYVYRIQAWKVPMEVRRICHVWVGQPHMSHVKTGWTTREALCVGPGRQATQGEKPKEGWVLIKVSWLSSPYIWTILGIEDEGCFVPIPDWCLVCP